MTMIFTGFCILCAATVVLGEVLLAPEDVKLDPSGPVLTWTAHTHSHTHTATFTTQYRSGEESEWRDVSGCENSVRHRCNFAAVATELYGASLRVRAQQHNISSPWTQNEETVKCVHTRVCSPEVEVLVSPGYLSVHMDRNRGDRSLRDEYGDTNLKYRVYRTDTHPTQVECDLCEASYRVESVSAGERVCMQVQFLIFSKPHGTPSAEQCYTIPQSEWERQVFLAVVCVCVFLALVTLTVGCYCFISRYYTLIKELTKPVHTPDALEDFPCVAVVSATPVDECCDHVVVEPEPEPEPEQEGSTSGSHKGHRHHNTSGSLKGHGGSSSGSRSGSDSRSGSEWSQSELALTGEGEKEEEEEDGGSGYNSGTPLL
ncbi:interferon gamma receptor 2 [Engraulis encrasicolus]|uniref:interferon gamma receptor 2 n=1 Tax=Engraulis encrasicolus TaxID=184585 RepID=UPI002FD6DB40